MRNTTRIVLLSWDVVSKLVKRHSDNVYQIDTTVQAQNILQKGTQLAADFGVGQPVMHIAICDGKASTPACNIVYSDYFVKTRNGVIVRNSGGVCSSPDVCTNCNDGFYSDKAYCRACKQIPHCNHHRCTTGTSSACHYCEGEYSEAVGEYVYDRWNNPGACDEVCSWRSTGKRCYPGTCSGLAHGNGLLSSCNCIAGFTGNHCENIEDEPVITDNIATFRVGERTTDVIKFPPLPTNLNPDFKDTVWTNFPGYTKAETSIGALYQLKLEGGTIPPKPSYIDKFKFGIIEGYISLALKRGGSSNALTWNCITSSESEPVSTNYRCAKNFTLTQWSLPFQHDDRVTFLAKVKNGGRTYYFDRDDSNRIKYQSLNGKFLSYSYELGFDYIKPYHCFLKSCQDQPLDVPDFTALKTVTITWSGWLDDLSGVGMYQYELFDLIAQGSDDLMTGDLRKSTYLQTNFSEFQITFPEPGAYFVILTCFDKAENFKSTRRILLFDDASVVSIQHQFRNLVLSATKETNYTWIIDRPSIIHVKWTNRFINERHHAMKWLNKVNPDSAVTADYDDMEGERTIYLKTNVNAILAFHVKYVIMYAQTLIRQRDFYETANLLAEETFITESLEDGERINVWVRAYDAVRAYVEDFVYATADSSPPVIRNLWLTKGDFLNVSVHNVLELNQMTIEWELFDLHSGIHNVSWRLFDNFTNKDYLHGVEAVPPQGEAENLAACGAKYGSYVRGANCYCTPFDGCYHKHFQVKPDIKDNGEGLIVGRDMGVHEYDYFIEITTYNRALLKTVLSFKLTIDISPPHIGVVHDGIVGSPEVDFQQSLTLNAYWEGFFDKESGIMFYRYKFSETCVGKEYFVLESPLRSQTFETTTTHATFTAPREGKYYITVAAYNHALEHSDLVCSDGVVIDLFAPSIIEVEVTGSRAVPGLVKDNLGNIWVLSRDRFIRKVYRPTQACRNKAASLSFFTDLPKQRHPNDTIVDEYNDTVCDQYSGAPNSLGGVLPSTHAKIGPILVDTTAPEFSGTIDVHLSGNHLVATWPAAAFLDSEDIFSLKFECAVGENNRPTSILNYHPLSSGGDCTLTSSPTCTAISLSSLDWQLHGHHVYYVAIKVTNTAGEFTIGISSPYIHDVQLPSLGKVLEVDPEDLPDIDFQDNHKRIAVTWSGFYHPHLDIFYSVALGTTPGGTNIRNFQPVNGTSTTFEGLNLITYQRYYVTLKASSTSGNVIVTSDGVMVVQNGMNFGAIIIKDGIPCNGTGLSTKNFSHHDDDQRIPCQVDIDYQSSANSLHAYWTVPDSMKAYTSLVYWSVEIREMHLNSWDSFTEYEELANVHETRNGQLILEPGRMYRSKVKFCASHFCGQPVVSNGVMVITDPPVNGNMSLTYTEDGQIMVVLEKFYDPSIENAQEARGAMDHYEWALTDNSDAAKILSVWERVPDNAIHALNVTHVSFIIHLVKPLDFSECRRLSIRGYNKVGMWSAVSMDIKDCSQIDPLWIKPRIVIDVVPENPMTTASGLVMDGLGQAEGILLQQNEIWSFQDQDYTPYKNILSAVWPNLRHRLYDWAVIEWNVDEQVTHFARAEIILENPCGHPSAIACGRTDKEYVNVYLNDNNYLVDGRRYVICIHANMTAIKKERWTEYIEAVSACSDGVTVDLAPPTPGKVWIGTEDTQMYQASLSDIMVHWESFVDLEVYGINIHPTTVQKYEVAVGSSYGGSDIVDFRNVGITNHATFHDLLLTNGHTYYATVRATDFVNRTMTVTSKGVKIDVTVPEKTNLPITVGGKFITSTSEVGACWNGVFYEVESEIDYYMWAVGSEPGVDNAMTYTLTRDTCADSDTNNPVSLKEGYPYFISVRAYNKLGLSSLATSWAYIVETSPPIAGHVYDGNSSLADQLGIKDLDFQTDLKNLTVRWEGFYDPHSAITSYYISVGTCPQCEDILTEQNIGIKSEVTLHHLTLVSGLTYFTSITACNGADMCTTVTSDGITLDNSPPISGTVLDGVRGTDIYYQASTIYLAAEWFGYSDSQSGLDRYTYRVGTSPGGSNIIPETNLHLAEEVIITDVQQRNVSKLPVQILIYTTIRVYNKAGLYAEAASNGFMVDNTPPVFTKEITLGPIGSMLLNTLVTRTTLMVEWGVYDDESFIDRQYVSIESHVGGDFNLSSIPLNGIVRDYIFTDLDLNDGSIYYVTVWCCNGAGLCTKSTTPSILMDSTPPTMGMFAINTDHAADQRRQSPGWMTWEVFKLNLAWLGFADVHSGIDYYNVTVGSTYMGRDLNKVPGEATTLYHDNTSSIVKDEGVVQTFSFEITPVVSHELIYIALWAVNKVGMSSPVLHQAFRLVFGGVMELVRRCSAFSCIGHCVCAPEDEVCSNPRPCTDKSAIKKTDIKVMDVRNLQFENEENVTHTASDTALAALWSLNGANIEKPIWYEWSVGYQYASDPQGIFDVISDRVWHDVGQRTRVVFSMNRGKKLSFRMKYSVFVRAWYADGVYAIFKSPGVIIDTAPPKTTSIQGAVVRDKLTLNQTKDIDFIRKKITLYAEWENKFLYTADKVSYFKIYVSTSPGGHDVHYVDENLPPSATNYFISFMNWKPYTKYYTNVIAYSYAGRHRTESSDGFLLDTEPPIPGVVYDGNGLLDLEFQNNSHIISAHWHGFTDKGSGIARYYVCATDIDTDPNNGGNCTLTPWRNNGIKTQVIFDLSEPLENGAKVKFLVYAVDFSGYSSTIVQSDGIHIDSTPPYPENKHSFGDSLVRNPSFELGTDADKVSFDGTSKGQCQVQVLQDWVIADPHIKSSCGIIYTSSNSIAQHGHSFAQVRGRGILQNITGLQVGEKYRVSFYASHLPLDTIFISNREGFVKFGDVAYVFLLYTKPSRKDVKTLSSDNSNLYWQYYVYYFTAKSNTVMLQFGSYDEMTGFALDQVQVQQNYLTELDAISTANAVKVQTVFIHDWASVHAYWSFVDLESPIVDYSWAVGYSPYGTHLQDYRSVGLETHSSSKELHLVHNTYIYVSILATNAVELTTKVTSDPIMIDLTPPVFSFVHDGSSVYEDKNVQSENVIRVVWKVDDKESGLDFCEWAIGTSPGGIDIQAYMTTEEKTSGKVQLPYAIINRKTLYSTIRCYNQAGLHTIKSSDGLLIITTPPNTESVVLDLVPQSVTEYTAMDRYQSNNTNIRLKWTGFEDIIPIDRYEVKLKGEGLDLSTVIIGQPQGSYTYMELQKLNLLEGKYTTIVTGINLVDSQSRGVNTTFTVAINPPRKAAGIDISIQWDKNARTITLSWPGLFSSNIPFYYEVSAGFNRVEIGQWISTTMTEYSFTYADQEITATYMYGIVRAVNSAGLYSTAAKYVNI
ncbi:hypothetical protein ACJMK2_019926 [Sinanodonta woodiana]|uniref:EGF-like domain-containing protein n=1 Tax=Sinanodonta woodiana TaxID=1069815 RepID=A0ABD3TYD1_SINWO